MQCCWLWSFMKAASWRSQVAERLNCTKLVLAIFVCYRLPSPARQQPKRAIKMNDIWAFTTTAKAKMVNVFPGLVTVFSSTDPCHLETNIFSRWLGPWIYKSASILLSQTVTFYYGLDLNPRAWVLSTKMQKKRSFLWLSIYILFRSVDLESSRRWPFF